MAFKPMLACDAVQGKIRFPCAIQPKIDGVRGLNVHGVAKARSMKPHRNLHTQRVFSGEELAGLDGELVAEKVTHPALCRMTSSATGTIKGEPFVQWWIFDDHSEPDKPYMERYRKAAARVHTLISEDSFWKNRLRVVPTLVVNTLEELLAQETIWLDEGYEGIIIRDMHGECKQGRSTVKEGGLLRIKRYVEEEALIIGFDEGETNLNEAKTNELGKTYRSSAKDGKVASGKLGRMHGQLLKDIRHDGKLLFSKDDVIIISPGSMTHEERTAAMADPTTVVGRISKFLFFPVGVKDKPRFSRHKSFVNAEDISA